MDRFDGSTEAGATGSTWATTQPPGNVDKLPSRASAPAMRLSAPCKSYSARLEMESSLTALVKRLAHSSTSGYCFSETDYGPRRFTATTSLSSESRLASARQRQNCQQQQQQSNFLAGSATELRFRFLRAPNPPIRLLGPLVIGLINRPRKSPRYTKSAMGGLEQVHRSGVNEPTKKSPAAVCWSLPATKSLPSSDAMNAEP